MNLNKLAEKSREKKMFFLIIMVGFLVRLYVFKFTYIIDNDGVYYINQARAIFNGNWELAKQCGYDFISIYHILIPVFYRISGDWIVAAKSISLLFGTLTIIPCYLILKHFLRHSTALITSLAFSINPFFVSYSVEVVKDPIFWFFALLGISFLIAAFHKTKKNYFLILGSLSFLCAGFARFEILIYIIGSAIYILFVKDGKAKNLFLFSLPIMILCIVILSGLVAYQESFSLWAVYFEPRIYRFFHDIYDSVFNVEIFKKSVPALSLLVYKTVKTLYLPMLPFLMLGLLTVKQKLNKNQHVWYIILLSLLSILALYLFYLKIGIISSRYTSLIILPAFVFIGFGIEKTMHLLKEKGLRDKTVTWAICVYIIIFCLPFNLVHKRTEKFIYTDIGQFIAHREDNQKINVIASDERIMFYTNLYAKDIACTNLLGDYKHLIAMEYPEMVSQLKEKKIKYFVWDKKSWVNAGYNFLTTIKREHFKEIKLWDTENNTYIAFEILY